MPENSSFVEVVSEDEANEILDDYYSRRVYLPDPDKPEEVEAAAEEEPEEETEAEPEQETIDGFD